MNSRLCSCCILSLCFVHCVVIIVVVSQLLMSLVMCLLHFVFRFLSGSRGKSSKLFGLSR